MEGCRHCSTDHETICRCGHSHNDHVYVGGCTICWKQFLAGKRKRLYVCEHYNQKPYSNKELKELAELELKTVA